MLPKTGIIGSVAAGFTIGFKVITSEKPTLISSGSVQHSPKTNYNIQIDKCKIYINHTEESGVEVTTSESTKSIVDMWIDKFGTIDKNINIKTTTNLNSTNLSSETLNNTQVIEELNRVNPDWLDNFYINSPNENLSSDILSYLLNNGEQFINNAIFSYLFDFYGYYNLYIYDNNK